MPISPRRLVPLLLLLASPVAAQKRDPLAISAGELDRLVDVTRDAIAEATAA